MGEGEREGRGCRGLMLGQAGIPELVIAMLGVRRQASKRSVSGACWAPEMLWGRPMSCRGAGGGEQTNGPPDTGVVLLMPQDDEVLELAAAHYADDFNEDTAVPNVVDACRLSRPAAAGIRARSRVGSAGCRWYGAQCVWGHGCIWYRAQYVRRRGCSQEPPSA